MNIFAKLIITIIIESIIGVLVLVFFSNSIIVILIPLILIEFGAVLLFIVLDTIRPLNDLAKAAKNIARGDFTQQIKISSKDEVGKLAQTFNDMTYQLRSSYKSLEDIIRKKTSELQKNIIDLERFNKTMVGRELTMIELKNENSQMKQKLGIHEQPQMDEKSQNQIAQLKHMGGPQEDFKKALLNVLEDLENNKALEME